MKKLRVGSKFLQTYRNGMFCFSPPVMLATFILEIALVFYTLWRYRMGNTVRLIVAILVFLATFQLAEYMICEAAGLDSLTWSRIGYVAITLLPPLGVHLAYQIAGAKKRPLLLPAYVAAAGFVLFFAFVGQSIQNHACLGNYVIFETAPGSGWLYGLYYYGLVVASMVLCAVLAKGADVARRRALTAHAIGTAAFLIPTTTINLLDHTTIAGIPSIMCGFAVLFAVTLCIWVLPTVGSKK